MISDFRSAIGEEVSYTTLDNGKAYGNIPDFGIFFTKFEKAVFNLSAPKSQAKRTNLHMSMLPLQGESQESPGLGVPGVPERTFHTLNFETGNALHLPAGHRVNWTFHGQDSDS
ncbi:MAG: hypothetical protein HYU36_13500 [Planctomycetes bacterium]|nr:hypothetical protein [Planctomycetota bacterium]